MNAISYFILFTYLSVQVQVQAQAQAQTHSQAQQCYRFYNQNLSFKNLTSVGTILGADESDAISAMKRLKMVDLNLADTASKKSEELGKMVFSEKLSEENLKRYLSLTSKSKILLSRLHERILLSALEINGSIEHSQMYGDYMLEADSKQLKKYQNAIRSEKNGDLKFKQEIAKKMADEFFKLLPSNIDSWESMNSVEKENALKNLMTVSGASFTQQIKWVETLLPIFKDPKGKDFFAKIFVGTLPDVYSIAVSRASMLPKRITGFGLTAASAMSNFLVPETVSLNDHSFITVFTTLFGMPLVWNANTIAHMKGMGPEHLVAGTNKMARKLFVNRKARKSLETETTSELVDRDITKKAESFEDQSLAILAQLKKELRDGLGRKDVDIPIWGRALSDGVSVFINRTENIQDQVKSIDIELDSIFKRNQYAEKSPKLRDKQIDETIVRAGRDRLQAILIDLQAMKEELLTLAYAVDEYSIGLVRAQNQTGLSDNYMHFAGEKSTEIATQSMIVNNLAIRTKSLENSILAKIAYLNTLYNGIQVKQLVD